ncbi:MAG: hypothetical protein ABJA67_13270 [Chthonomonadales bacterium]
MLTSSDRKYLEMTSGNYGKKLVIVFAGATITFLALSLVSFWGVGYLNNLDGQSYSQFLHKYGEEVAMEKAYRGVYLKELEFFNTAFAALLTSACFGTFWWKSKTDRARSIRIVETLKASNQW